MCINIYRSVFIYMDVYCMSYICQFIKPRESGHYSLLLTVSSVQTEAGKMDFQSPPLTMWNNLHTDLKLKDLLPGGQFKTLLKTWK